MFFLQKNDFKIVLREKKNKIRSKNKNREFLKAPLLDKNFKIRKNKTNTDLRKSSIPACP